jgi:hypothetical protein
MMMGANVALKIGDRMVSLADVLERYSTSPPVAQFAFDNDDVECLPVTIGIPAGIEVVFPSGERFARKVYGHAGVSFASKTYTRRHERAQ